MELVGIAVMFLLWMFPSHKLFDHTLLLVGIWTAVLLVEQQSTGRTFTGGLFIGLCLFFGRNHALYNFLAQFLLLILLQYRSGSLLSVSRFGIWISGILVGLIPLLVLFVCARGFASSYIQSVRSILHQGTNLFLPIPWPWQIWPFTDLAAATRWLLGIFFVALPVTYIAAIAASSRIRSQAIRDHALFVAAPFVGLFYLHHAFSRADSSHLAQVIHPFLVLVLALPLSFARPTLFRWTSIAALSAVALFTIGRQTSLFQRLTSPIAWEPLHTSDTIFVPPSVNRPIACLQRFCGDNIPPGASVFIAPFTPGLYPILGYKSPLWQLAFYFPAPKERQKEMIRELEEKNVTWTIIADTPPDKREDLRLSATHELLWQYLTKNFEPVQISCLPRSTTVMRRKAR
jgi:hypothetical protein